MKRTLINISIFLIAVVIIVSTYNYLDVHIFRKSLVKNYVDDSYLRPNFVAEFEKLKDKKEPESESVDSMIEDIPLEDIIVESSVWVIGGRDVSMIREEWHFKMFDYLKSKNPENAEKIFKRYLEIKNEEILSLKKLESNFGKISRDLLAQNNNVKDSNYYKKYQTQLKAKDKLMEQTQSVMQYKKVEVFGKDQFEELTFLSKEFLGNVGHRLIHEYNFTETEVQEIDKDYLSNRLLFMP